MFDQLHDPNPPTPTSHHLAVVAERAAGLRRRRNAMTSGVAAVALLAAGTVGVAAVQRGDADETPLADAALPATDGATITELEPEPTPTPTVLDPTELPPAVPVNPDPEDLPPAVPVNTDATDTVVESDSGDEPGSADAGDDGQLDPVVDDDEETTPDSIDEAGSDLATAAALRSSDPLLAVTADGAGVWFPSLGDAPVEVDRGDGLLRIDFFDDGAATVERRDDRPTLTVVETDGSEASSIDAGAFHAIGPAGDAVCGLTSGLSEVTCLDRAGDELLGLPFDRTNTVGLDLMWIDADTVLVLGRSDSYSVSIVDVVDGSITTRPFASLGDFDALRWAGRSNGDVVIHEIRTDRVLVGSLDDLGGVGANGLPGSSLEVRELDAPMQSVWFDGAEEILVDLDGILTVDGVSIPGTYASARR